jgi:hypothetical protein
MRAVIGLVAVCACLTVAPVMADDGRDALSRLEPGQMLRGLVRESDVALLFDFLRGSLAAALQGREAPPVPEELAGRAEALGNALKVQGAFAALALFDALEQRAKRALREVPSPRPLPPPLQPFTPLQE